jgi:hypothetical protein
MKNMKIKHQQTAEELKKMISSARRNLAMLEKSYQEIVSEELNFTISSQQRKNSIRETDSSTVIGFFDGEKMVTEKGEEFSVPANYASKSKLVVGDKLKLIIKQSGVRLFKVIENVKVKNLTGKIITDGKDYQILSQKNKYKILPAVASFFALKTGDKVFFAIPENLETNYGTIEYILP